MYSVSQKIYALKVSEKVFPEIFFPATENF